MLTRSTVVLALLLAPTLAVATTPDELLETLTESLAAVGCDCGCGMTVLECLHDDPSCRRSPEMARQILAGIVSSEAADGVLGVLLELRSKDCPCGCEMNVLECLDEDPTCPMSPDIAKQSLARLSPTPATSSASPSPPQRSAQTDCGSWCEIKGQLIVHISSGSGYRTKECIWLYVDGTYDLNNQTGSVTSLGSHAAQGGGGGTWTVEGNNLVMAGEGGGNFPMSYSDGTFYLGNWRYFIVELDDPTCQ